MNEVKEVKGVMILDEDGILVDFKIYPNRELAEYDYLVEDKKTFRFVTVTAKIEITGAA